MSPFIPMAGEPQKRLHALTAESEASFEKAYWALRALADLMKSIPADNAVDIEDLGYLAEAVLDAFGKVDGSTAVRTEAML